MPAASTDCLSNIWAHLKGDGAEFDQSLVAVFERVVETRPMHIALDSGAHRLTYWELNAAANRLAHRLCGEGAARQERVAILMAHDAPLIAAVVGILKSGRIVVVLSPDEPAQRLGKLIDDAEPIVLLTDSQNRLLADDIARPGCEILNFEAETAEGPTHNLSIDIGPEQISSLVYTSGTTGQPKGVMQTHRQILRDVAAHTDAMQYDETDRIPLFSALATGQGASGIWCALLNGATLCPFSVKSKGFTGLAGWMLDRGLTVYVSSASIFRALVRTVDSEFVFPNVRAVRLSSESVTSEDVASFRRHFLPETILVHTLASSETGNIAWARWTKKDDVPAGRIPIGRVSRGIEVLLLGEDGRPVQRGEIGEIAVKSRYVAAGYWRDPELTAQRFSSDLDGRGTRLVRNGDWGRINAKGHIEFAGRKDDRIKIRGNRIELADIESALAKLPGIEGAAAVAVPRQNNEPMLVAFVVKTEDASWSMPRLRHAVSANLPLHMVPSRFVFVDRLPFGASGKIDRDALRTYQLPLRENENGEVPQTETETLLADIWAEVLDVPQIFRDDDFFNLGGDSLKGAVVAAQVHSAFGIALSLGALADHPTIFALASFIEDCRRAGVVGLPPILSVLRCGPAPLSLFQERVWRVSEVRPDDVCARSYRISGSLNIDAFKECLGYLIERHAALRTAFAVIDGRPMQIVYPSAPLGFSFYDVSNEDRPEERAEAICTSEAAGAINPKVLPLTRHVLIKVGENEHWLLRISHPLTQDGSSITILMNELTALYEAKTKGMDPPIPRDMPLQYVDYAVWHREIMRAGGPRYMEMLAWWRQLFAKRTRATKLPFRRSTPGAGSHPNQGVIHWRPDDVTAERLSGLARRVGVTYFIVRLACFIALLADLTGRTTVVIGTGFSNRHRIETRNIVGLFSNLAPLVFSYRPRLSFNAWLETVRNRLFDTGAHAELPFEELYEKLRALGLKPPGIEILFLISSDHGVQQMDDLTIARRPHPVGNMPWGCQVYIDERIPENCRVDFDASLFHRDKMQAMIDRYIRLLKVAAEQPNLPIGMLVALSSNNPVRRACAKYLQNVSVLIPPWRGNSTAVPVQSRENA
jgi:amino acid adenylation domain-containing protein